MIKNVKIINSLSPSFEVVGNTVMKLFYPYSSESVTVQFDINIQRYDKPKQNEPKQNSELMVWAETNQTVTELFDFDKNNVKDIKIDDIVYNVQLMNIGKNIQGQNSLFFEFLITWND